MCSLFIGMGFPVNLTCFNLYDNFFAEREAGLKNKGSATMNENMVGFNDYREADIEG